MRILVTGGAGFVGSHSVDALLAAGHEPIVLDDLSTGKTANLPPDVRVIEASILDNQALLAAMDGCEAVLHLAAIVSVPFSLENPLACHAVNATGSLQVLEAARRVGAKRVVLASSAAVYGDSAPPLAESAPLHPLSPYGLQKQIGEEYGRLYALHHGLEVLSLRYFNIYGPRQDPRSPYSGVLSRFVDWATQSEPATIFGDGQQTRDFVFVRDVARANLAALMVPGTYRGAVFNIGTGRPMSILDAHAEIVAAVGPPSAPRLEAARLGDIRHSHCDAAVAREVLGWWAQTSFKEGVRQTIGSAVARAHR